MPPDKLEIDPIINLDILQLGQIIKENIVIENYPCPDCVIYVHTPNLMSRHQCHQ